MNVPTHCPLCGAGIEFYDDQFQGSFKCGTVTRFGRIEETRTCLRNRLAVCEARILELNKAVDSETSQKMSLCMEWAEAHTYAQNVAMSLGYTKEQVEGDSYGVPGIETLIDMIAEKARAK